MADYIYQIDILLRVNCQILNKSKWDLWKLFVKKTYSKLHQQGYNFKQVNKHLLYEWFKSEWINEVHNHFKQVNTKWWKFDRESYQSSHYSLVGGLYFMAYQPLWVI